MYFNEKKHSVGWSLSRWLSNNFKGNNCTKMVRWSEDCVAYKKYIPKLLKQYKIKPTRIVETDIKSSFGYVKELTK